MKERLRAQRTRGGGRIEACVAGVLDAVDDRSLSVVAIAIGELSAEGGRLYGPGITSIGDCI